MKKVYKALLGLFLLLGIISFSANVQAQMYSLSTVSNPSVGGYASPGGGYYSSGQQVTVIAIPVNGYVFAGWTGSVTSYMNPVTITMNSNKTLIANFVLMYNLTVNSNPSNGGYVSGAGTGQFPAGQPITVYAVPSSGYHFVEWSGAASGWINPTTFTMNSNLTITANFEPNFPTPIEVSAGLHHALLLKSNGTLWAWGSNQYGEIGNNSTDPSYSPVQILPGTLWKEISASRWYSSMAIKSDGTLWAWGNNDYGKLGIGSTMPKNIPTQIGSETNWAKISAGNTHCLAIKADGSLYAWGYDSFGELGDGLSQTEYHSPKRIGNKNNWIYVSAGSQHSMGIQSDGTLWAWGANVNGELGLDDTDNRFEPTQVGTDKDWKQVCIGLFHTLAIKKDGSLWAWGDNQYGKLGNGGTDPSHVPIRIGLENDWKQVSCMNGKVSLALKNNGTVWGWGLNQNGEIGDGSTDVKYFPTPAIGATNESAISSGGSFSLAVGDNNYLCGTGYNVYGELGNSTTDPQIVYNCIPFPVSLRSAHSISRAQESKTIDPSKSTLSQNYPNPTQGSTTIEYYLTNDVANAKMVLYSFTGTIVKEYALNGKGKSSIDIDLANFPAGIYSYALFVNGSKADVRKLLLVK